ncbi:hypothetical protein SCUP515_11561 [Seiridium cupressi]
MESVDDSRLQLLSMLPPFLQARLPMVPARLRSFASLNWSVAASSASFCNNSPQPGRRSQHASAAAAAANASSVSSSYSEPVESSSSESSFSPGFNHYSAATSLSAILASEDDHEYTGENMDRDSMDHAQYEQLLQHFLRSLRDMDTRRQLDSQRLLEGPQMQPGGRETGNREPRLPRNFDGQSHDAVDRRWSPSGIKWRYARQGAQLATDASNELHDAQFERSAYIDAVAYYLRACPDQLDHGETAKILFAAPWLAQQPHPDPRIAITRPTDRGRTFLSDAVQYAVVGLLLLGHMFWCFLLSAFRIGAYFEREYRVSQWLMTNGHDLANSVGRHSVTWTARINAINDGPIGQVVSWTMDSVTGGIQEGYGKGMDRIRRQRVQETRPSNGSQTAGGDGGIVDLRRRKPRAH